MQPEFPGFDQLELVGRGTNTDVFRAVRASTGGLVALKVFHAGLDAATVARRLKREVDALVVLRGHPNIISLEEVIHHGDLVAIVMEYAPGGSLGDVLRADSSSVSELVQYVRGAAMALATAHRHGIVHRDVKPENLLLGAFGDVKVCDFGMAALEFAALPSQTSKVSIRYASPEELDGVAVTAASDVYSLGAVLFHAFAKRAPKLSDRGSIGDVAELRAVPPGLISLIDACMAEDVAARPKMSDVVRRLGDSALLQPTAASASSPGPAPTSGRSASPAPAAAPIPPAAPTRPPPPIPVYSPVTPPTPTPTPSATNLPPAATPSAPAPARPSPLLKRPAPGRAAANETVAIAFARPKPPEPPPEPSSLRRMLPIIGAAALSATLAYLAMHLIINR